MPDLFSESPRSHSHGPSILTVIVLLCGGAWFLQSVIGAPLTKDELPAGALSLYALREGQWWTSLTYMLTHKDFFHLGTNMLILILAGRKVLAMVGPQHFAYIFLIGGWMGAAISLVVRPESALIGASGAVFGVVGAYCALDPWANILAGFPKWVRIHVRARYVFFGLLISFVIFEIASHVLPAAMHAEQRGLCECVAG